MGEQSGSEQAKTVRFYSVTGDYGELSNFARYPITVGKKRWHTSEHLAGAT